MRKFFLAIAGLLALFLGIVLSVNFDRYAEYITQNIKKPIKQHGIEFNCHSSHLNFIGLTFDNATLTIPKFWSSIKLDHLTTKVSILKLLSQVLSLKFDGLAYDGTIVGDITCSDDYSQILVNSILQSIDLSKHPQLEGLGITSGRLDLNLSEVVIQKSLPVSGTGKLQLSNFELTDTSFLQLSETQIPFSIKIPVIKNASIELPFTLYPNHVDIEKIAISSSLLTAKGSISLNYNQTAIQSVNIAIDVELSDLGSAEFKDYLPIISGNKLTKESRQFTIKLVGKPNIAKIKFLPTRS